MRQPGICRVPDLASPGHLQTNMHACTHAHVYMHMHTHTQVYTCTCAHPYTSMHTCMHAHTCTHGHMHTCNTCIHIHAVHLLDSPETHSVCSCPGKPPLCRTLPCSSFLSPSSPCICPSPSPPTHIHSAGCPAGLPSSQAPPPDFICPSELSALPQVL